MSVVAKNTADSESKLDNSSNINLGSLLRLFKSSYFDEWLCVSYIYRYPKPGVHDYLCNQLYQLKQSEIEFYLPQLCNLLLHKTFQSNSLERFILDRCADSVHFALKVSWLLQAFLDDGDAKTRATCARLKEQVEISVVNCCRPGRMRQNPSLIPRWYRELIRKKNAEKGDDVEAVDEDDAVAFALSKKDRCEYFNRLLAFVDQLGKIGNQLVQVPPQKRKEALQDTLKHLNEQMQGQKTAAYLPGTGSDNFLALLAIPEQHAKVLKSRDRAPYLLILETLEAPVDCFAANLHEIAGDFAYKKVESLREEVDESDAQETQSNSSADEIDQGKGVVADTIKATDTETNKLSDLASKHARKGSKDSTISTSQSVDSDLSCLDEAVKKTCPFGAPWSVVTERIRKRSPFGHLPNWRLISVIVKAGDDCRQEQLAVQLLRQFEKIFKESKLPLYVRPYRILATSNSVGIIETIPDTISIHQLKASAPTIREHFLEKYGGADSEEFKIAQRNFAESLAAYSIICYLMQVKDRHNGNILLDQQGHIVHIDFGFMLWNSPGSINFETAPFKLTKEYIDVLDGVGSSLYHYFVALVTRGFMVLRKYSGKIILLVEMMQLASKLPCFQGGEATVNYLKERFFNGMTDEECVQQVEDLIERSLDNWRTIQYDKFQYITNNIRY
mmetsp:Transcript_11841/g.13026  ORF Transcript_11841/g.13026 Transcript_11841/m.13026 type:complete len:673 (+) Transcript_11841:137-2155(+)